MRKYNTYHIIVGIVEMEQRMDVFRSRTEVARHCMNMYRGQMIADYLRKLCTYALGTRISNKEEDKKGLGDKYE